MFLRIHDTGKIAEATEQERVAHELIQIHASCFDEPHLQAIHEITQAGPLQRICLLFEDQIHQGTKLTTIINLKQRRVFSQKLK